MKRLLPFFLAFFMSFAFSSCVDEEELDDTPTGNFEALWKIIDERYCFFDYKSQEYGLDWNAVHAKYRVRVNDGMSNDQLFEVMADMLAELRDGHVNLSRAADFARYWSWQEDYPANLSDSLLRRYLGTDYMIASGLQYRVLDDNIGYVRYESFSDAIGEGNIDEVINRLMLCRGLIIDIRGNGGGTLTNAERLAARFTNEPVLVGYIQHKTGPGHNDFSAMEEQWINPSANLRWQKPVCVLTNRSVYSAANEFVKPAFQQLPAQRLVCALLGLPHVRCRWPVYRVRHRARLQRVAHRCRLCTWARHHHRVRPRPAQPMSGITGPTFSIMSSYIFSCVSPM